MSAPTTAPRPLNVAIVGAGLEDSPPPMRCAGRAMLSQLKANQVFESSPVNKEIGAVIGFPPNVIRVLETFGYNQNNLRTSDFRGIVLYSAADGEGKTALFKDQAKNYGRTGTSRRAKRLALGKEGAGPPVQIRLGTKIVHCETGTEAIASQAGETFKSDVVIAADGIRVQSTLRTIVVGHAVVAPATGICALRWMADASKLKGRPELDRVLKNGILGACLVVVPDIQLAEDPITLWQLRALPIFPTWTNDVLHCLKIQAAHATFPTLGQGAAEDAAALGCMLPMGTKPEEVSRRLAAYQDQGKSGMRLLRPSRLNKLQFLKTESSTSL
ncbi:FAD/NAD(P)-binding domain-containing protein [Mycena crocata]|nr:FAD/NAD(P)-binding domain-containing protein [Mycena crocata]